MEYTLDNFTIMLKSLLYEQMPVDSNNVNARKHPNRSFHMRDLALGNNMIIPLGLDSKYFEIGSDIAEDKAPYYHILEDAQVIHKKGYGTKKSKGSQANVGDTKTRDYGQATYSIISTKKGNKINPYNEYRKNVRGSRSLVGKATQKVFTDNGKTIKINRESKYYLNVHYHYIERGLEIVTQQLAHQFDMKLMRVKMDYTEEAQEYFNKINLGSGFGFNF